MALIENVVDQVNLRWAWEKVKRSSGYGDVWIDQVELAGFELELERNLNSIADDLKASTYSMRAIRPMAFPKAPKEDGEKQVRQYFCVSIRDQVAWTAFVNVIGPHLDSVMPPWSYGNRLYRTTWIDDEDNSRKLRIGRYRNSTGNIYQPFQKGWPRFRRHVYLTTRAMSHNALRADLSEEDKEEYELTGSLEANYRCPFIFDNYWKKQPEAPVEKGRVYWCSLDLEKFFPSLNTLVIEENIINNIPSDYKKEARTVLSQLLEFTVDPSDYSASEMLDLGLDFHNLKYKGIPTGLHVAGFLSNVAMINVDKEVSNRLYQEGRVAHFRYVDDHMILSRNFEDLQHWVKEYLELLRQSGCGARLNFEKACPEKFSEYLQSEESGNSHREDLINAAKDSCALDPEFPAPLMTKTLTLVSSIGRANFNLLEDAELSGLVDQLEQLLLVDLPEEEIPAKTRQSFSAMRLAKLAEFRMENMFILEGKDELASIFSLYRDSESGNLLEATSKSEHDEKFLSELGDLKKEVNRIFALIKKVLHDRPDRVRLWSRAIYLCFQTGVAGLVELFSEIESHKDLHPLAREYLVATSLSHVGYRSILAARRLADPEAPIWQKVASYLFLSDAIELSHQVDTTSFNSYEVLQSWRQYCFGLFCAELIVGKNKIEDNYELDFPSKALSIGGGVLSDEANVSWAWLAVRADLQELRYHRHLFVKLLGDRLGHSEKSAAFWKFFPEQVPSGAIYWMASFPQENKGVEGWWRDTLSRKNISLQSIESGLELDAVISRAIRNINYLDEKSEKGWVTLYEWLNFSREKAKSNPDDPRISEWTCLELIKQIAETSSEHIFPQFFGEEYVHSVRQKRTARSLAINPANFLLPEDWLRIETPSWSEWMKTVRATEKKSRLHRVPDHYALLDWRYAPIRGAVEKTINPIRSLGMLLICMLRRSFELPAIWNGVGHSDILMLVQNMLFRRVTCSSFTLGLLQSCLQARSVENVWGRIYRDQYRIFLDDDTENDPYSIFDLEEFSNIVEICQTNLEHFQLSTYENRARQLIPVDIKLLTEPNWDQLFSRHLGEGVQNEED